MHRYRRSYSQAGDVFTAGTPYSPFTYHRFFCTYQPEDTVTADAFDPFSCIAPGGADAITRRSGPTK